MKYDCENFSPLSNFNCDIFTLAMINSNYNQENGIEYLMFHGESAGMGDIKK